MGTHESNTEKDYYKIIIVGNCGYPIHIIESAGPVSFEAEMVIWKDYKKQNISAYRLKPGEQVEVFTIS